MYKIIDTIGEEVQLGGAHTQEIPPPQFDESDYIINRKNGRMINIPDEIIFDKLEYINVVSECIIEKFTRGDVSDSNKLRVTNILKEKILEFLLDKDNYYEMYKKED